jgi:hypothetical protein
MRGKGLFRARIELAGVSVALDRSVKLLRIERLEPRAKPRQLARIELFDGFFNVFGGRHGEDIALPREAQKGGARRLGRRRRDDGRLSMSGFPAQARRITLPLTRPMG